MHSKAATCSETAIFTKKLFTNNISLIIQATIRHYLHLWFSGDNKNYYCLHFSIRKKISTEQKVGIFSIGIFSTGHFNPLNAIVRVHLPVFMKTTKYHYFYGVAMFVKSNLMAHMDMHNSETFALHGGVFSSAWLTKKFDFRSICTDLIQFHVCIIFFFLYSFTWSN